MTHSPLNACYSDLCDASSKTEADTMGVVLGKRLTFVLNWLKQAYGVSRQRSELARLDDQQLHDIGLTREVAEREANRPFWDLP